MSDAVRDNAAAPAVTVRREGGVALLTMANPPVNALGHRLRAGLMDALDGLRGATGLRAVVLAGSERAFSAGADITEFGRTRAEPSLRAIIAAIGAMEVPVIAAIHGVALGGGCELALGCHARLAWKGARLGLPEIKLGLIPGAGGTQLLPRLIGVEKALQAILTGTPIGAEAALADGLIDAIPDGPYPDAAIIWARGASGLTLARERIAPPADLDAIAAPYLRRARGAAAPGAAVEAVRAATALPYEDGLARELALFQERVASDESRAQRHAFFAERAAQKIPDMPGNTRARPVERVAIIGAGTMGGGIAMCFANVGVPVTLVEAEAAALSRGLDLVRRNYATAVSRGSLAAGEPERRLALISTGTDLAAIAGADLVIEAVFEDLPLKQRLFAEIDRLARPGAVLATNTSTLDVNAIAQATRRPTDLVGMHFFSPANVMRLLEVVRGEATGFDVLATAIAIGRRIGKIPVTVGVCDGFVGNRMLHKRSAQADRLLLEGAAPEEVDRVLTEFGFPMGPFAMGDLAGLDISWRVRQARGTKALVADRLCEAGRFGQKAGAGYYRYEKGARTPLPDPEVTRIAAEEAEQAGIARRALSNAAILDRLLLPMLNEGARILEEGIAARPGDIDVIWLHGYGWPAHRGGPMHYADQLGLPAVRDRLDALAAETGDASLRPAPLLNRLAAEGRGFANLECGAAPAEQVGRAVQADLRGKLSY